MISAVFFLFAKTKPKQTIEINITSIQLSFSKCSKSKQEIVDKCLERKEYIDSMQLARYKRLPSLEIKNESNYLREMEFFLKAKVVLNLYGT